MEKCVHMMQMPSIPAKIYRYFSTNQGVYLKKKKRVVKSKIEIGLPLMVTDLAYKFQMIWLRAVPELNVWEGRVAASFFFTWVVGFLINKILWVVGDIKIKISCLVGKLKPT